MSDFFVGSRLWSKSTQGHLSWSDRAHIIRHGLKPGMTGMAATWFKRGHAPSLDLDNMPLPDTALVKHALEELASCAEPVVVEHSLRTYYWGAAFGQLQALDHDPELLLVGCLLHDLGMTDKHHGQHQGCRCFAVEGAEAAESWGIAQGMPEEQTNLLYEMISLHMNAHVAPEQGAEAHLLQQGAACDVVGARWYELEEEYREAVLANHPRLGLNDWFIRFALKETRMRPDSRTALVVAMGFPLFIKMNPFAE